MKKIQLSLLFAFFALFSYAQNGTYIKYEMELESDDESMSMMIGFMNGSSMSLASDNNYSYVKTMMGTLSTTEVSLENDTREMKMLMTGMMGDMAYEGNADSLANDTDTTSTDIELLKETKKILGYKCKKATMTDEDGSVSTYWYTDKIERPTSVEAMPNQLPGICLEMQIVTPQMQITYVATEIKEDINASDYQVEFPEGVEVMPLSSLNDPATMGGGM